VLKTVERLGVDVVAKWADDVDRNARFPVEAFDVFKESKLLSAYVPAEYGGMGLSIRQICKICETLGEYCASTAMVYAMHQIQVACIVHHGQTSEYFRSFLKALAHNQWLLASATTELGVGGDLRSSICALEIKGKQFSLTKQAPVVSYALASDFILITCRASPDSPSSDQKHVVVKTEDCEIEEIAGWDTLGFRGTCSSGYTVKAKGETEQILPVEFSSVLAQTMHPVAHLTWGSLWVGMAEDAVRRARKSVRILARRTPGTAPVSALRLSEVDEQLFAMKGSLKQMIVEYQELIDSNQLEFCSQFAFATKVNNVKLRCSEMLVDIVGNALQIVGISGYKNDSDNSLCRHIRDAYGAALMVNNDRIRGHNSTMHIAMRD